MRCLTVRTRRPAPDLIMVKEEPGFDLVSNCRRQINAHQTFPGRSSDQTGSGIVRVCAGVRMYEQ